MCVIAVITALIVVIILANPAAALSSARAGLGLFMQSVLPAALPTLILTNMLQRMGALRAVGRVLERPVRALLGCPGAAAPVLIISYICGTPTGSRALHKLYADGGLSKAQTARIAAAASTVSPPFIIAAVGVGMLGSASAGYVMAAAHILGALLNGVLFRLYKGEGGARAGTYAPSERPLDAFTGAVKDGAAAIWVIGAVIVLCSSAAGALEQWVPPQYAVWVRGALEVTLGTGAAAQLMLPLHMRVLVMECLLSFSGLSIHAQALAMLGGAVDAPIFILSKITHAAIATALCALMLPLIQAGDVAASSIYRYDLALVHGALLAAALLAVICAAMLIGQRRRAR